MWVTFLMQPLLTVSSGMWSEKHTGPLHRQIMKWEIIWLNCGRRSISCPLTLITGRHHFIWKPCQHEIQPKLSNSQLLLPGAQVVLQFSINNYQSETFLRKITHQKVSDGLFGVCDMINTWELQNRNYGLLFYHVGQLWLLHEWVSVWNKCEWRALCKSGRWMKTCNLTRTLIEEPVPLSFT